MRIKHFFGLAVIAAMTASCSSNNDLVNGGNGSGENETGVGYATLSINLPTTNGTRAGEPAFNPGDAKEYDVKDVTLLIFKEAGSSEGEYTFVETADLGTMAPWVKDNDDNGITTAATITAKLDKVDLTSNYYALVILNNKDNTNAPKVKMPEADQTYSAWNSADNAEGTKFADNTNGFYMANAPVFTAAGTEPKTLVKIDKVYATKQAAETSKATTIHVERGLAKVTVAPLPTNLNPPADSKYHEDVVDITAWNLDVTNKSTFPIHKTAGLTTNFTTIWNASTEAAPSTGRFVDRTNTAFKRVYWGVDPNYDKDYTEVADCKTEFKLLEANAAITGNAATPQYCLENTFDIKHMLQGQTTRVVFKATYTPHGFTAGDTFYKIGNNTDLWSKTTLEEQIKAKAQEVLADASKITLDLKAAGNNIEEKAGTKILTEDNVLYDGVKVSTTEINSINEKLGLKAATPTDPIVGIATYASGESYYIARIKHFGNELTPWNDGDVTYGNDDAIQNNKYLGRYGVLRNNWYELTVTSVSGPGTPDVPTIKPEVPDDENYRYINVSVKILDWAKRSQSVDL